MQPYGRQNAIARYEHRTPYNCRRRKSEYAALSMARMRKESRLNVISNCTRENASAQPAMNHPTIDMTSVKYA